MWLARVQQLPRGLGQLEQGALLSERVRPRYNELMFLTLGVVTPRVLVGKDDWLFLASRIIPGVSIVGTGTFILAALLLGLVNALVRPVAFLMTLPLTIITLGLFLLVLNAAMFGLVAALLDDFTVSGFWAAVFGAIVVSLSSTIASWFIGPSGRYEVIVVRRR